MMKTLFVLIEEWNEQDNYSSQVVGVTDNKAWAHAFSTMDQFAPYPEDRSLEVVTLNVLDGKLLARIEEWLDPARNPLCTCGHRKLHHRSKGKPQNESQHAHVGRCKHNRGDSGKKSPHYHMCKGFVMAKEQPRISFDRKGESSLTPGEWRESVDGAIVSALQEE
jgi:hypothetical protein